MDYDSCTYCENLNNHKKSAFYFTILIQSLKKIINISTGNDKDGMLIKPNNMKKKYLLFGSVLLIMLFLVFMAFRFPAEERSQIAAQMEHSIHTELLNK